MTGTPWLTVNGGDYFRNLRGCGIYVEDREGDLYPQISAEQHDFPWRCPLSYYSLGDLGLHHGTETPDIFNTAIAGGAKTVPYGIALRTLIEHPDAFQNGFLKRLFGRAVPFRSCLLGIKPLIGQSGRKYVVELADKYFRFRRADEDIAWGDNELWVFAT